MATKIAENVKNGSGILSRFFSSALTYIILFAFLGASLITSGVFVIFGLGLGLISGGIFSLLFMAVIYRGMSNG